MSHLHAGLAVSTVALTGFTSHEDYVSELRDAEDHADVSLHEAIVIAEATEADLVAVRATLLVDGRPRYAVRALRGPIAWTFLVSLRGTVEAKSPEVAMDRRPRSGAIPLVEALAIAEDEAGGSAVSVTPDADVAGAFAIQVLTPDALWDVLVSSTGDVLRRATAA